MSAANLSVVPLSTLPPERREPLTPPDCDLRDFRHFMLDMPRLKRSKSWLLARGQPELGFYMMNLWTYSVHEVPAASVEEDDDVLAAAAMCERGRWDAVKHLVMRGWVPCTDGRLYHPVVAEKACEAWEKKRKWRNRGKAGAAARWPEKKIPGATPPDATGNEQPTGQETEEVLAAVRAAADLAAAQHASSMPQASHGQCGRERERERENSDPPDRPVGGAGGADPEQRPPPARRSAREVLGTEGVDKLVEMTGRVPGSVHTFLGKQLSVLRDDASVLLRIVQNAHRRWVQGDSRLADPVPWIVAAVQDEARKQGFSAVPRRGGEERRPDGGGPKANQATEQVEFFMRHRPPAFAGAGGGR